MIEIMLGIIACGLLYIFTGIKKLKIAKLFGTLTIILVLIFVFLLENPNSEGEKPFK